MWKYLNFSIFYGIIEWSDCTENIRILVIEVKLIELKIIFYLQFIC